MRGIAGESRHALCSGLLHEDIAMAAVLNIFARLRKNTPAPVAGLPATAQDAAVRSPEHMIASCEYELRQVRRDVFLTRQPGVPPPAPKSREPFVLGAGLRRRDAAR